MRIQFEIPATRATLTAALEGLTAVNCVLMKRRDLPQLYRSGIRYEREQPGRERWLNADELLAKCVGDCEDLAAYRAAELRVYHGVPAIACVLRSGPKKFHAVVGFPDGTIEDPSRMLGMGRRKR